MSLVCRQGSGTVPSCMLNTSESTYDSKVYLCIMPPGCTGVIMLDFRSIASKARFRRPVSSFSFGLMLQELTTGLKTCLTATYHIHQAGLHVTFPNAALLDAFCQCTVLHDLSGPSGLVAPTLGELQELGCTLEEDITVAYHMSFIHTRLDSACDFLVAALDQEWDVDSPEEDYENLCNLDDTDMGSCSSDEEAFYDTVESLKNSWLDVADNES